jgi:hypothetical protein
MSSSSTTQQQVLLANGSGMEEFLSEFLSVYTCGAYGSSSSDPATAQFNKPKSTVDAVPPAAGTAATSSTTTTLAKHDGGGAMEEFISEFVSFYSCNVGLPTLPPPQSSSSAESNEEEPTTTTTDGQLAAKEAGDEEEGAVEEFLREFIAFYSMGTIGTTDPTSNTSNTTTNIEPSIEKAKAYYPASSPTESNPGKSTSEEDMGMMKEFLREFVAFYTLQGDDVVAPPVGVDGESPMFAPAVSPEKENTGAADNNKNSPAIAESRNDTPTVDNDDDDTEDEKEEEDDTNVIEAVANNTDNGLPFPLNTMENKPASSPTASSSSSSSSTTKQQKKKSSRSFVPKKMKKLFSSKKKSASAQAVQ